MDITIQRDVLLKPLQAISGLVEKKQTHAILSNVLLTAKDNQLCLTGTDLEVEFIGFVPLVSMAQPGSTTVSARKLFDICRALPEGAVLSLVQHKSNLQVRAAGMSHFTLNMLPPQDFPSLDDAKYTTQVKAKQVSLKNVFTKTYFAMAQQDVRHYLNGTLLEISHHMIKAVAADGHRLALATEQDDAIESAHAKVILPRKSVLELIRLLASDDAAIAQISVGENRIRFATDEFIFTSKLINALYPDYNRLIPKGITVAVADREGIKHALSRAAILSSEKIRGVRFLLEPNKLLITANNTDQEQAEEALPVDYTGEKVEIGFNVAYLLDAVAAIVTKHIRCEFTDPNNGVLIKSADGDHSLYVVMPMRL